MDQDEIREVIGKAVAEATGAEPEEVVPEASLLNDLDAESIDLLDILFRIERRLGIKIEAAELAEYVQGGIPDEEFGDADEIVTERGLNQLKLVMPQIDTAQLVGNLQAAKVMGLFTVDNLVQMVVRKAEAGGARIPEADAVPAVGS
ncbi:acyl carrier protein [Streptomyces sp. NBC_01304]|uniref:acyl carrier protein n=1 Tax=Streptomyces sp. NBC_01304 TaxID=2903818 RepID=UPI002E11ED0C|nr:phosphopantetheine-binding protein [Streptomyces sp. NBC_01304]